MRSTSSFSCDFSVGRYFPNAPSHMENQIINDNEETTFKFIVQNEAIRTDDNKHISEESEANGCTNATKLKKTPERNKHSILTNN